MVTTGRSEEKEVDVALGEVACPKMKDHLFFVKFVLQTTVHLLQVQLSLMLKPKCNFSNLKGRKKKRWMLRIVMQLVPKKKAHLLFVKFALLANVQLLQRRVRFLA